MQTADFYSSATGTLRVNGGRDENTPQGVSLSIDDLSYIKQGSRATDSGNTGTTDYNELVNKPKINSITLTGNVLLSDIGAQPAIDSSHKVSADNIDDTSTTNKFATVAELEQIETNKNNILNNKDNGYLKTVNKCVCIKPIGSGLTNNPDLTCTYNGDGTYTLNGVSVSSGLIVVTDNMVGMQGLYISGSSSDDDRAPLKLYRTDNWSPVGESVGGSVGTISYNGTTRAAIIITAGQTYDNVVYKPMIADSNTAVFEPYTLSNIELYQLIISYHNT